MAQATRRRGAGGQTARREGWQAHRRTGRDRAAHRRTRSRKQAVAHHRGRPGHHGKSTRSLGVTVRESGLRRAAQEALTETFAMLTGHGVSTRQAATLTGLVRSTATRRRNAATALTPAVCTEPAVEPANKLTDAERRRVVEVLTSDRFVDLAPLQIYAQLLDEGVYLCSVSTMYRVLGQHTLVAERRRLARHPSQVCPELVATAPQQVYRWDITKLAGPVKGTYFDAYVIIDIYTHWYNHEHRHTGIGLHTPADVHFGLATDKAADRRTVLTQARARHPHRFGTVGAPKILDLPDTAWINRPAQNTTQETATTAA